MARPHAAEASPPFLFATCQVGAEVALKAEIARRWPHFSFAYSRPGFLTFKLPPDHGLSEDFDPHSVFARACGFSLGQVTAKTLAERAHDARQVAGNRKFDALHVWQRDAARPGWHGFEPQITPAAHEAEAALREGWGDAPPSRIAEPGQLVLDCMLVEPDRWCVGYHRARDSESCLPGGLREVALPAEAVSRAYMKMAEALQWSGLPIRPGQRFVELGCAPGGASQALLARGLHVIGIDPARVDPIVLAQPRFTHIRKRGADVRRRDFGGVSWLAADMNVTPRYTLDTVEAIVTHPAVNIRGVILTLKLAKWELAEDIPKHLQRIRGWGYKHARARQLAHNRQEVCVAAVRHRA